MSIAKAKPKKLNKVTLKENLQLMVMTIPGLICLILFNYLPMPGIVIAFKKLNPMKGMWESPWVGMKNFEFFFKSQDAVRTIRNTVVYSVVFLVIALLTNVGLALMLYYLKNRRATKIYNTIVIIPKFMSMVIVSYIVYALLSPSNGVLNQIIRFWGGEGIKWYSEPRYWPFILTFVYVWQGVGMGSVLYYSSLMSMDESMIEAAKIDGANLRQQIWHVIIPHLIPIITITTILAIGGLFSGSLDLFYQVPRDQGVLYPTTDIINTYVYRALVGNSLEKSAAVNLFQSLIGMVLVIVSNSIVKKISPENSFF
ncbi:MAG: sugar ABC transporter permease [Lachnospiraceae bacterium]|nr:sugar ABC transporter permease [Lachnospiraceae bacterium]